MSFAQTIVLGGIAGFTIFLGLPFARIRRIADMWRIAAGAAATGVLIFLLIDVAAHMVEPVEEAAQTVGDGNLGRLVALSLIALGGLVAGYLGLVLLPGMLMGKKKVSEAPGAAASSVFENPRTLSLLIATGIGLHNFAEGLAIGHSAATGAASLALLLVIGFGLHNATECFGITGPLIGKVRPSWGYLGLVGLIGGGPTFLGTIVGRSYANDMVGTLFLALAAGSILFVVQTMMYSGLRSGKTTAFSVALVFGLILGIATDLVIAATGV